VSLRRVPTLCSEATYVVLAPELLLSSHNHETQRAGVARSKNGLIEIHWDRTDLARERWVFSPARARSTRRTGSRADLDRGLFRRVYGTGAIMAVPGHDERDFAVC